MAYLLLTNWLLIIGLMIIAWIVFSKTDNPGIIDFFWPITISISGIHFFIYSYQNDMSLIFVLLLLIWAIRLSGFLLITRIAPKIKERRYDAIIPDVEKNKSFLYFKHFQFQGILGMIIATPFLFMHQHKNQFFSILIGSLIIFIGLIGEILSDYQLQQFKKTNPGKVCNHGLWQYSRHPNYFFEWIIWLGFAIGCFNLQSGWIGLISPLLLLFLMMQFTIPITENASIQSRKEKYVDYQKNTPVFFPTTLFRRK